MAQSSDRVNPLNNPKLRGYAWQFIVAVLIVWLVWTAASNAAVNLKTLNKNSGLGFWNATAGFDIPMRLIEYSATSTYGRAFWVGLLNTLFVSAIGIVLATILGFFVGVARLSSNFMISSLAAIYVEFVRNTPLLLQLLIWYNAVLKPLPEPRNSISIPFLKFGVPGGALFYLALVAGIIGAALFYVARNKNVTAAVRRLLWWIAAALSAFGIVVAVFASGLVQKVEGVFFLNNRGLYLPSPNFKPGWNIVVAVFGLGILGAIGYRIYARRRQDATGQQSPVGLVALGLIVVLPIITYFVVGQPVELNFATQSRFNLQGGVQVIPEFVALLVGLVIYTAAFIGENVRAGIQAVSKGQTEAAYSLGLRPGLTTKLVIIPQALRVIIPPLTSQYLNLTKNSSLAVAIAYPDLVQVFMGTVLNQTHQEVEVIAITMLVYLTISLTTSLFMNWYNARMALVER